MKFCNLVKLKDQYCGGKFQLCRGFQYEVKEATKRPGLFYVKASLAVHAPPLEFNMTGAQQCPQIWQFTLARIELGPPRVPKI